MGISAYNHCRFGSESMEKKMTIERFNPPASTQRILAVALMILALITFVGSSALAEPPETERRIIPVTIKKGENYTISDVKKDEGAPASKVVDNPNALVVQDAPAGSGLPP
jgi:hypothetical protein